MDAKVGEIRTSSPASAVYKPRKSTARLSVGFILAKRFTLCAFANFVDVLRLAADEGDRSRPIMCNWNVLSDTMSAIPSSSGVSVQPNERLGDPTKFDYLVVVGGVMDDLTGLGSAYVSYLTQAAAAGVPLIGLCTGGFLLHKAGLMKGYRCCVSWFHHADFLEQFDGLDPVSDQIFIDDGERLTCSGGASSAHLAAYLVERHVGRAQASKSLHIMIIDDALRPEKPQPGVSMDISTRDPMVMRALLLMQQNIDTPLSVAELAKRMGHSKRQLERHFRSALGASPQAAFLQIRLTFARHLIETTDKLVASIAVECGFCDSSHLSRMFRQRFDMTPQEVRRHAQQSASIGEAQAA
ncbi:GlxA family transcriptional regulator [Aureimonas phyllosphaerae]|uniref:Transcriptional regulator GlxA family with amidase domain n=1 Tax=Aureimonas phyllosphaerae TaxID=1166078 RepID=A0A7W6BYU2_9HYPH|nr:GlxA family transcriptional regulator [Aureimonas phyllosphaerae]MBB3935307.1 transcriptional regulator GlxA family with amidase domain [Aureimonas phyllosphaerae]MBB3959315.1 transcriptional regulator GlxA family with amidase domain [Aureimonas phyllosphaerae]SFF04830.1 Transcriptional regulator GlxA family, contains an amidase domain and an AraC-type DNA-binding HTH domain [Aureimonas phyllosphaerae]